MIVSMWMSRNPISIGPDTPLSQAARIMSAHHIRRLPVVDSPHAPTRPVGIVTATDILHAYPPQINPFAISPDEPPGRVRLVAKGIMSRALHTASPDTPIEDAARMMRDRKISTLLVVHKGLLTGLITESDIFRAFVSILESTRGDVRVTFDVKNNEDIFCLVAPIALRLGVQVLSLMSSRIGDRSLCVIRIAGEATQRMIDELWSSGHPVLNVVRLSPTDDEI